MVKYNSIRDDAKRHSHVSQPLDAALVQFGPDLEYTVKCWSNDA